MVGSWFSVVMMGFMGDTRGLSSVVSAGFKRFSGEE